MDVNLIRLPEGIVSQVLTPFPIVISLVRIGVMVFGIYSFFALISRVYSFIMFFWTGKFLIRNSPLAVGRSVVTSIVQAVGVGAGAVIYYGAVSDGVSTIMEHAEMVSEWVQGTPDTSEVSNNVGEATNNNVPSSDSPSGSV